MPSRASGLRRDGKRWRPFLTACAYKAFRTIRWRRFPDGLRQAPPWRSSASTRRRSSTTISRTPTTSATVSPTMHAEYGVPVALNVGDLLLGEGYRLLADCGVDAKTTSEMIRIAATGHRRLCLGQGAELAGCGRPLRQQPMKSSRSSGRRPRRRLKSALGSAPRWRAPTRTRNEVLSDYSDALGIAYQIRDDIEDPGAGVSAPSLILALACDKAKASGRDRVMTAWRNGPVSEDTRAAYRTLVADARRRRPRARAARIVQGSRHPLAAGVAEPQSQRPAAPRHRQSLPRGDQGLVQ